MDISSRLNQLQYQVRSNRWMYYFYIFLRIVLAFGFVTSGIVKIMGERFAAGLSVNHPMGQYLEALHNTGFYYTFIGIAQVLAAILILIPRTVILGVLLYFPIILNICVLSYAVRFEGSTLTSPLMVLACIYLIFWNYDKIRYILPIWHDAQQSPLPKPFNNKFPFKFFSGVIAAITAIVLFLNFGWKIAPRNNSRDCNAQFNGTNRTTAGKIFCDCIHNKGLPLDSAIAIYEKEGND